jgi:glycosyltransferase involved in cell wall biosynthesis
MEMVKQIIESSIWRYYDWLLNQCAVSITPSRMIADIICAHTEYCPEVISNGVDLNLFSPHAATQNEIEELCKKYQIRNGIPIMLYVGRIDADKQVDLVVKAAAKVMEAMEAQLIVVGDGKQREDIMLLSQSLGIRQNCCFPGFIPKSKDLPRIFRLADVFVTASEIEIQSSVVLEAMASGNPVVTVKASSMPEFVEEGVSGYLVPPGDVKAMAERLVSLLVEPGTVKLMGQAGRSIAKEHSNERFIEAHDQVYKSLALPVFA